VSSLLFLLARRDDAVPRRAFESLRRDLLSSPLLGDTTLNGPFRSSRGFAMTFKAEAWQTLAARFPSLVPYLARVLGRPAVRALTPWFQRVGSRIPNAWYLNVLSVGEGGQVGRHVDATLRTASGDPDALPEVVSVLYLAVPRAGGGGGELRLWRNDELLGIVRPAENTLVHFRGDCLHDVSQLQGLPRGAARASLVIEQYYFQADALSRLPEFHLESRAGFAAHLDTHRQATASIREPASSAELAGLSRQDFLGFSRRVFAATSGSRGRATEWRARCGRWKR
jgi:hypothetical protein